MKKTLLAIFCIGLAFTSWAQDSDLQVNFGIGLGIPSEAAKEVANPSDAGTFVYNLGLQLPVAQVYKNTSAILGLQFTQVGMTHDDKHSPADFGEVSHDLVTNTSLIAPTLRFETALGDFFPYVEAGAGLMTQRSNIVTTTENAEQSIGDCAAVDITKTKLNDMQSQIGMQSSVGLSYGKDNWKVNLSANFIKGTRSFLMPERNFKTSFDFDAAGHHYVWRSVKPDIVNIQLGVTLSLNGDCMN